MGTKFKMAVISRKKHYGKVIIIEFYIRVGDTLKGLLLCLINA